ncbi:hypothetical protein SNE40_003278 [Patella caerulea]|uniref:Ammonium transporter n=1 Tax=Patella caerulea TaxID=87958 RepID=A0AAN8KDX3_PATCE
MDVTEQAVKDFRHLQSNLDQFFLIIMGMIVLLMQCGFAFLEAGAVRSKNSTNILIKNLMDQFVAGIAYWIFGFPFAFGNGNDFIGYTFWATYELEETKLALFFFQYVFAATAATIVSGAMAERCEFIAYIVYSILITGFIYPVVTHWVWSDNAWLTAGMDYTFNNETVTIGYKDFAGSGVVHVLGGIAALVGASLLGPRKGRFHKGSKTVVPIRGHSVPLAALGGFILLFGFLAFNGGSQLTISNAGDGEAISLSVVNTIISGSMSALVSLIINRLTGTSKWSLLTTLNGALTGMVAICAGCNVYHPWAACVVGFFAAIAYKLINTIVTSLYIDDPLDAVAVHFGGGSWGVIAVAFLHRTDGIVYNWDQASGMALAWQLCGLVTITAWTAVTSVLMFGILKLTGLLRVAPELEAKGLDIPKHGEPAYPTEAYGHGWEEKLAKILEHVELKDAAKNMSSLGDGFAKAFLGAPVKQTDVGPYENPEVNYMDTHSTTNLNDLESGKGTTNGTTGVPHVTSIDVKSTTKM